MKRRLWKDKSGNAGQTAPNQERIRTDATLVAYAEEQGHRTVFTPDSDFGAYRIRGRLAFRVIPQA